MITTIIAGIATILCYLIKIYMFLIVVYALLSWLPGAYESKLGQLLGRIVNPFLSYFNFAHIGMLGFGPIIALVVLEFLQIGVNGIANILISWFP